jgi:uncharacterized membrane protein
MPSWVGECFSDPIARTRGPPLTVADRPVENYERGPATAVLRVIGPLTAVIGAVVVVMNFVALPATVTTHFGIGGEADSFGPRWSVLVLAGVWLVLQTGIALLATKPRLVNYPTPVTTANAQRLYREGERMIVWLGVAVAMTFAGLTLSIFDAPGGPLTVLGVVVTFAATMVGIIRIMRAS